MTKDEALDLALEALERATRYGAGGFEYAKDSIKQALAAQPAPVQEPVKWSDYEPDGRRYPAVPDALTSADIQEHIEYVAGWNDCRAEMLRINNG
jgi:hypothetical protein